jgi:integrase
MAGARSEAITPAITGEPAGLMITGMLYASLVQDALPTDCVFTYTCTGVSDQTIRSGFKKACRLAGIPCGQAQPGGLVRHDLRHTFATRLREQGVHELDIMQLMGHSSVMMTSSYAHGTPNVIQGAVDRLTRRRGEVVEFGRKVG